MEEKYTRRYSVLSIKLLDGIIICGGKDQDNSFANRNYILGMKNKIPQPNYQYVIPDNQKYRIDSALVKFDDNKNSSCIVISESWELIDMKFTNGFQQKTFNQYTQFRLSEGCIDITDLDLTNEWGKGTRKVLIFGGTRKMMSIDSTYCLRFPDLDESNIQEQKQKKESELASKPQGQFLDIDFQDLTAGEEESRTCQMLNRINPDNYFDKKSSTLYFTNYTNQIFIFDAKNQLRTTQYFNYSGGFSLINTTDY
ncbi:UNKNOWN [Stylonychia lemnae]|uniref:Uncharacterized protein n=1 Tax=Stylonychia lemnae TaxID=5949 RepID=A0A078AIM7_STYLE|nr:UNKNOWN [Stylonychia lemnae]|eukprot:CDW82074.1 UNKNOWN [Stylonychia lemnae]